MIVVLRLFGGRSTHHVSSVQLQRARGLTGTMDSTVDTVGAVTTEMGDSTGLRRGQCDILTDNERLTTTR